MKKIFYALIVVLVVNICLIPSENVMGESIESDMGIEISEENFPDEVLREILEKEDENGDGFLSDKEIKCIKSINLDKVWLQDEEHGTEEYQKEDTTNMMVIPKGLTLTKEEKVKRYCEINLKGIDKLTSVRGIRLGTGYIKGCEEKIYNLNLLYKIPKLIGLTFIGNSGIKKLQLYKFQNLKNLTLVWTDFEKINFGKKSKIEIINMVGCSVKKRLDISQLKRIKKFYADYVILTGLKMGKKNRKLEKFYLLPNNDYLKKCKIKKLDFSNLTNLKKVEVRNWPKLESVKFKKNNKLENLTIFNCAKLKNLYLENCNKIKKIKVSFNMKIKNITIKKCKNKKRILKKFS
ncbi:MAG: hypothetical protein HFG31_07355 [Eubacterium sp.]|nr:hypothetical protein [Eubacterium sp.]